ADPLFITGPDGYYYLRQMPPEHWGNSPCVDAGSDTAARLGLAHRSTRTDGMPDTGRVDLGYHRRATPPHVAWLPWVVRE
ncbi:MAG: hypothetical protein RMN24_07735, partial [Anaerolineae bacterium]|nr:hypothetical protein [Anaerolineae bacterium]